LLFGAVLLLLLPLQVGQADSEDEEDGRRGEHDSPALVRLKQQVSQLQAQVSALQTQLAAIQANTVLQLDGKLTLNTDDTARPTALFTGVNVQVVNGLKATETTNNMGNLIVGYNEPFFTLVRNGSHNIVVGYGHEYTGYGGLVAGYLNTIRGGYASVSGGGYNNAIGQGSSVSGGNGNTASGTQSSVSGGNSNNASGQWSSVSGGHANIASSNYSSVSGGASNTASGNFASVSGGQGNTASDFQSWAAGVYHTP